MTNTTFNRSAIEGHLSSDPRLVGTMNVMPMVGDVIAAVVTFVVLMLCWMLLKRMTSPVHDEQQGCSERAAHRRFADAVSVV